MRKFLGVILMMTLVLFCASCMKKEKGAEGNLINDTSLLITYVQLKRLWKKQSRLIRW